MLEILGAMFLWNFFFDNEKTQYQRKKVHYYPSLIAPETHAYRIHKQKKSKGSASTL